MRIVARLAAQAVALALVLAACARPPEQTGPPPTAAAGRPAAALDTTGLRRIRFAHGTTSGILDDSLGAGATRSYLLGAMEGQVMLAQAIPWPSAGRTLSPAAPEVRVFSVPNGQELATHRAEPDIWGGRLPLTADYIVRVTASERAAYTLVVQIPRRVELAGGQSPAIFTGMTPPRAPVDFLVKVEAGRTLEVVLGGAPTVALHVYGLDDGVQLAPLSDRRRLFAGRLETTQDYVVSVVPGPEHAAYDLRITLR
jgi:hypothetical protein